MDSTYRKSMEDCLDYYKKFEKEKRCLLSSTIIDFSDPDLKEEQQTIIKYDLRTKRNINVLFTDFLKMNGLIYEVINETLNEFPEAKIFIAYNSVSKCYDIAEKLVKDKIITAEKISLLCSKNNEKRVSKYFKELKSDKLPTQLNFVTSAYYTGFDIKERYHLIAVSSNRQENSIHTLSDKRIKQIVGRCRIKEGLFSETIIHDIVKDQISEITLDSLLKIAKKEIDALTCMYHHFKQNEFLKKIYDDVSDMILKAFELKKSKYIKRKKGELPKISYLNIDAQLENNRTQIKIYMTPVGLTNKLRAEGHRVIYMLAGSEIKVESNELDMELRNKQIEDIIIRLPSITKEEIDIFLAEKDVPYIQRKILESFRFLFEHIRRDNLIKKLKVVANSKDSRKINNFNLSAKFTILPVGNIYKNRVFKYFPVGEQFTKEDILTRWNIIFVESNMNKQFKFDEFVGAVKFMKIHLKCKRSEDGKRYRVVSDNPLKLKLIKHESEIEDIIFNSELSDT